MGDAALLISAAFGCPEDLANRAAPIFRARIFQRGDLLFRQGETCPNCWLIVDGSASLRAIGRDGQLVQLAAYGPGELAGAFPAPRVQDAELAADGRTEVIEARVAALVQLMSTEPALGVGVAALIARQHQALLSRLANQMTLSAVGRIYSELLERTDPQGWIRPAPVLAAIALRVNTTRETASRAVAAAERRGLLARDPTGLRILSRARLEALLF